MEDEVKGLEWPVSQRAEHAIKLSRALVGNQGSIRSNSQFSYLGQAVANDEHHIKAGNKPA